jgi:glycosyltransferase involved in cell wall biosynthesis
MKKEHINARVLIVTHNNADLIDRTMESLQNQTIPRGNLYINIVDYGSTDGTYEKLLAYDPYHLGIYRVHENIRPDRMLSDAQRFQAYGGFGMANRFTLRPGDTVAPRFIEYCGNLLAENWKLFPAMVICETDIQKKDGSVVKQIPLFKKQFVLMGQNNAYEYLTRGYKHKVICFGTTGTGGRRYSHHVVNDLNAWNKQYYANKDRRVIYINKSLACLREDDVFSFENLLWLYACLLSDFRYYEIFFEKALVPAQVEASYKNLAFDAFWRCYNNLLTGNIKEAEDCFMLSEVIYPGIVETARYQSLKKCIDADSVIDKQQLEELFNDDETLPAPKKSLRLNFGGGGGVNMAETDYFG